MNPNKTCKNCLYYDKEEGECHRYAPRPDRFTPSFPVVYADDWCGEWANGEAFEPQKEVQK